MWNVECKTCTETWLRGWLCLVPGDVVRSGWIARLSCYLLVLEVFVRVFSCAQVLGGVSMRPGTSNS